MGVGWAAAPTAHCEDDSDRAPPIDDTASVQSIAAAQKASEASPFLVGANSASGQLKKPLGDGLGLWVRLVATRPGTQQMGGSVNSIVLVEYLSKIK